MFVDSMCNVIDVENDTNYYDADRIANYPQVVFEALKEELDARVFFDSVMIDTTKYKIQDGSWSLGGLSKEQIEVIAGKTRADAIVAMDVYQYANEVSAISLGYDYYSVFNASNLHLWRIYDVASQQEVNAYLQKDTIFWDGVGANVNDSFRSFPSFQLATKEAGMYAGEQFANYLSPRWESVERRLYTSGNIKFLNATDWVNADNWDEAERLWRFIHAHGSKNSRFKAALNMALSLERKGDIQEAVNWAYKAYSLRNEQLGNGLTEEGPSYSTYLYMDLCKRLVDLKKLDEQFGSDTNAVDNNFEN
jgi:hypothetical protein